MITRDGTKSRCGSKSQDNTRITHDMAGGLSLLSALFIFVGAVVFPADVNVRVLKQSSSLLHFVLLLLRLGHFLGSFTASCF